MATEARTPSPESRESLSTRGRPDYHDVLGNRLEQLAIAIRELVPGATTRCYGRRGPCARTGVGPSFAGLGWIGKNMMLIHPEIGSFTFIGVCAD